MVPQTNWRSPIGEALLDLEVNSDLKTQLRELYITGAKELEVGDKKKCLIVLCTSSFIETISKDPGKFYR